MGDKKPVLEMGGWNVQTEYQCNDLKTLKTELKAKEPLTVTARIANTFLDGSRVTLLVDGEPTGTKWAWARGGRTDELVFDASFSAPGEHTLAVGDRSIKVKVNP